MNSIYFKLTSMVNSKNESNVVKFRI